MLLDPRGPRFAAGLTAIVFVLILVTGAWWLALAQAAIFAITAVDPRRGPYALLYRTLVAPRLGPPADREPAEPVRFAQALGGVFAVTAAIAYGAGGTAGTAVGIVAAAFGLGAAFLNSVFGLCLGCELYLAARRAAGRPLAARVPAND
jgi:nitrate/nitrite transporter NarK